MKKRLSFSILFLIPAISLAQPPEEIPPPPPDAQETVVPPPPAAAPAKAPVAEPMAVAPSAPAAPAEDKTVRGVTVSPGIGVFPIGYDKINIGDGVANEGGRYFFSLKPNIGVSSAFKTGTGRTLNFSVGYSLEWREYMNKDVTSRDFLNEIEGSLVVPWDDRLSTNFHVVFDYFYKTGPDTNGDNILLVDFDPTMGIKVMDNLSFKIGAWIRFANLFDSPLDPSQINESSDPLTDIDDFRRGSFTSNATGYNNFAPTSSFGLTTSGGLITSSAASEDFWFNINAALVGVSYTPTPGTTIGTDYRYAFFSPSNLDTAEWKGHYITPKITQSMPWKGGTLIVFNELRLQKYDFATVDDGAGGQDAKQALRNRFTLIAVQGINDYMSFEGLYRWEMSGNNGDNYEKINDRNWFYMGVNFGF